MRLLSRASFAAVFVVSALYIFDCLPSLNEASGYFGLGFFWAWLTVTLPITLILWCFPLTFGSTAFKILYAASLRPNENPEEQEPAVGRRVSAVLVMMMGFFVSGQLVIHFIISPAMRAFLDEASLGEVGGATLLAVWSYVLVFLSIQLVYPFLMALFMLVARALAPAAASYLAYQWRGYIRGAYPFMSWVFSRTTLRI